MGGLPLATLFMTIGQYSVHHEEVVVWITSSLSVYMAVSCIGQWWCLPHMQVIGEIVGVLDNLIDWPAGVVQQRSSK